MKRRVCFDFVKGYFVLAMAVYHWMNYCIIGHTLIYRYVNYVAEGFIFFSGYLCGEVYYNRFREKKQKVVQRLSIRAIKIFSLFVLLNVIIYTFLGGSRGTGGSISAVDIFFNRFYDIFIVGNDSLMAFEILLPISYMLALCPLFFISISLTFSLFILIIIYLFIVNVGVIPVSYNIQALMIGFGGVCTSMIIKKISFNRTKIINIISVSLAIVYFVFFVPFVHVNGVMVKYIAINIVIVNLIIACSFLQKNSLIVSELAMIGKFSLLLYLFQILYLQVISFAFPGKVIDFNAKVLAVFAVLLLSSSLLCRVVIFARRSSSTFDHMYKIVFQ